MDLVYSNVSNISLNPHMYEKLPYDGQKDFAPVTRLGLSVLAMVVPSSLRPKTLNAAGRRRRRRRARSAVTFEWIGAASGRS